MSQSLCVNSFEAMLLAGEDNYWKDTSVILYITTCDLRKLTWPNACETDEEIIRQYWNSHSLHIFKKSSIINSDNMI